jgi:hypothetical protein
MRLPAESKGASSAYFMKRRFHCNKVEALKQKESCERSAAKSKDLTAPSKAMQRHFSTSLGMTTFLPLQRFNASTL